MNKRDIAKFHKLLEQDVKPDLIATTLGIEKSTLKKFTPEKVAAAAAARKSRIQAMEKVKASNKEKAAVIAEAVSEVLEDNSDGLSQGQEEENS